MSYRLVGGASIIIDCRVLGTIELDAEWNE